MGPHPECTGLEMAQANAVILGMDLCPLSKRCPDESHVASKVHLGCLKEHLMENHFFKTEPEEKGPFALYGGLAEA